MEYGTYHKLTFVFIISFQSLRSIELCALRFTSGIMQAPNALIVCKCDNLFDQKKTQWTSIERHLCSQLEPNIRYREGRNSFQSF